MRSSSSSNDETVKKEVDLLQKLVNDKCIDPYILFEDVLPMVGMDGHYKLINTKKNDWIPVLTTTIRHYFFENLDENLVSITLINSPIKIEKTMEEAGFIISTKSENKSRFGYLGSKKEIELEYHTHKNRGNCNKIYIYFVYEKILIVLFYIYIYTITLKTI